MAKKHSGCFEDVAFSNARPTLQPLLLPRVPRPFRNEISLTKRTATQNQTTVSTTSHALTRRGSGSGSVHVTTTERHTDWDTMKVLVDHACCEPTPRCFPPGWSQTQVSWPRRQLAAFSPQVVLNDAFVPQQLGKTGWVLQGHSTTGLAHGHGAVPKHYRKSSTDITKTLQES